MNLRTKLDKRALWLAALLLLVLAVPMVVSAQGGGDAVRVITDDEVNEISSKLYCPVCENIPLDVCGTAACARWRAQVRTLLEGGSSEAEVINYFVEQFGQRVVGTPQDPLLSFLSWFVPALSVVGGLGIVGIVLLRWRRSAAVESGPIMEANTAYSEPLDDYHARLEQELRESE